MKKNIPPLLARTPFCQAQKPLATLQAQAKQSGANKLSLEEIDEEIAAVRNVNINAVYVGE